MIPFLEDQKFKTTSKTPSQCPMRGTTPDLCKSEEDDMYLFDNSLRQSPTSDPGPEFAKISDSIVTFALKGFLEFRLRSNSQNGGRYWSKMRGQPDDMVKNNPAIVDELPIPIKRHFPCPFYICNPEKHLACLTRVILTEIRDVKQHLWDAHRLQPYCPVCGETFATTGNSSNHIRRRSCIPREVSRPEGISLQQMQQLARRAEAWMSEDLQWLCIWEIVFPGTELPDFTHPSRTEEIMVCRFQDYWSSHGEQIIFDFLKDKGIHDDRLRDEERSLASSHNIILNRVIDRLVEGFKHSDDSTISTKTEQVLASLCPS
ncbi:hypothetical protein F4805DRAFT_410101 [Annulohypoxylon moriforme]|nr:hypothetical protein F4805DRAFT_410101 [Annulohypoxylon moriforme]